MKFNYKSLLILVALATVTTWALWQKNISHAAPIAQQQRNWSLGGEARLTTNTILPYRSAVQLTSRCPTASGGIEIIGCIPENRLTTSGIIFTPPPMPAPKLRFADLYELSTDFTPRTPGLDSDCGAGSPRFEIGLDLNGDTFPEGNLFIYLGPLTDFRRCNGAWQNSGNLVGDASNDRRYDITQFGGKYYGNYSEALARVGHGAICYILLVVDSGWFRLMPVPGNQNIHANNVRINEHWLLTTAPSLLDVLSMEPVELVPYNGSLSDWQWTTSLENFAEQTTGRRLPVRIADLDRLAESDK